MSSPSTIASEVHIDRQKTESKLAQLLGGDATEAVGGYMGNRQSKAAKFFGVDDKVIEKAEADPRSTASA